MYIQVVTLSDVSMIENFIFTGITSCATLKSFKMRGNSPCHQWTSWKNEKALNKCIYCNSYIFHALHSSFTKLDNPYLKHDFSAFLWSPRLLGSTVVSHCNFNNCTFYFKNIILGLPTYWFQYNWPEVRFFCVWPLLEITKFTIALI